LALGPIRDPVLLGHRTLQSFERMYIRQTRYWSAMNTP